MNDDESTHDGVSDMADERTKERQRDREVEQAHSLCGAVGNRNRGSYHESTCVHYERVNEYMCIYMCVCMEVL